MPGEAAAQFGFHPASRGKVESRVPMPKCYLLRRILVNAIKKFHQARVAAGAFGFLTLIQVFDGLDRYTATAFRAMLEGRAEAVT